MDTLRLVILGATGSIGTQALDVVRMHADRIEVVALAAGRRVDEAVAFAREFGCKHLAFAMKACVMRRRSRSSATTCALALAQLPSRPSRSSTMSMSCSTRFRARRACRASYDTLKAGRTLALANKESLVVGGDLIMPLATHETLLPVDSEHSAIYQCYLGEFSDEARRIWLTCSGGPFRGMTREQLAEVTAAQALAHPTWNMGPKITIDSATLMNKGLEVIEAQHLFDVKTDDIRVVVHPQSCVHSMVEYVDGSVKAHLGVADHAHTHPVRAELSA